MIITFFGHSIISTSQKVEETVKEEISKAEVKETEEEKTEIKAAEINISTQARSRYVSHATVHKVLKNRT